MDMGCGRFSRVDIEVTVSVIIRAVSEHGAGSWISCFHLNSHINSLFYVVFISKPTDAFLIIPRETNLRLFPRHQVYLRRVLMIWREFFRFQELQNYFRPKRLRLIIQACSIQYILATCSIMGDTKLSGNSAAGHSLLLGTDDSQMIPDSSK